MSKTTIEKTGKFWKLLYAISILVVITGAVFVGMGKGWEILVYGIIAWVARIATWWSHG